MHAGSARGASELCGSTAAYATGLGVLLTDLGSVPRAGYQEVNMPKLDWQVNGKNHASFLYNRLRWTRRAACRRRPPTPMRSIRLAWTL